MSNIEDKSEYYREELIKSMIFSYIIKKGRAKDKITFDSINSKLSYQFYFHHKLPITMEPLNYGKLLEQVGNKFTIQVNKSNIAIIKQFENLNEVKFFKEGDLVYEYKDHKLDETSFVRSLENKKFTYKDNKLVLLTIDKSSKFISQLNKTQLVINKIITLDIETYINDGITIPYVIS
jgi:hypothetical protein